MTDLFSPLAAPTPSRPSRMTQFFRQSASGRDSPRTLVADELFNLHIGTPPLQREREHREQETLKSFKLEIPTSKLRKRTIASGSLAEIKSSEGQDPLFGISPTKRRSPRKSAAAMLSPLEEMDTTEEPPTLPFHSHLRPISPPPEIVSSDDEMDELDIPDERTRYLRQKKRMEQISNYRMRELKDDRESRIARRNNPLSPKSTKVKKVCIKRVKFEV
jgi:hypothetical protein